MTDTETLLREQWAALRAWIEDEGVLGHAAWPSGLGTWSIRELVVHLGFALRMVAELTPARHQEPIPVARYVAGYAPAREQIAEATASAALAVRGRELSGLDEMAGAAWRALDAVLPPVVLGRRGPLRSEDFLLTRLLEMVVHGDDLQRSLAADRSPLLPAAVDRIAALLAEAYLGAAGRAPAWSGIELIRVATGRVVVDDPALPLLS